MNDDVTLNRKKISRFLGKESVKVDQVGKAYSNEQIAKMLRVCDERTKVIILLLERPTENDLQEFRKRILKK